MNEPKSVNLGPVLARPDLAENDPKSPHYVRNRMCYSEGMQKTEFMPPTLMSNVTLDADGETGTYNFSVSDFMETGITYTVKVGDMTMDFQAVQEVVDGVSLNCIGDSYSGLLDEETFSPTYGFSLATSATFGNVALLLITSLSVFMTFWGIPSTADFAAAEMSVEGLKEKVHKLPNKYLPVKILQIADMSSIASVDFSVYDPGDIVLLVMDAQKVMENM